MTDKQKYAESRLIKKTRINKSNQKEFNNVLLKSQKENRNFKEK